MWPARCWIPPLSVPHLVTAGRLAAVASLSLVVLSMPAQAQRAGPAVGRRGQSGATTRGKAEEDPRKRWQAAEQHLRALDGELDQVLDEMPEGWLDGQAWVIEGKGDEGKQYVIGQWCVGPLAIVGENDVVSFRLDERQEARLAAAVKSLREWDGLAPGKRKAVAQEVRAVCIDLMKRILDQALSYEAVEKNRNELHDALLLLYLHATMGPSTRPAKSRELSIEFRSEQIAKPVQQVIKAIDDLTRELDELETDTKQK